MLIALLRDRKQARMTEFTQAKVEDAKARAEANECNLGLMHASDGAAKDICMTKAWARVFRLAADQGYALPQTYLDTEAEVLFRLAADRDMQRRSTTSAACSATRTTAAMRRTM
jgi:hypothetical protein